MRVENDRQRLKREIKKESEEKRLAAILKTQNKSGKRPKTGIIELD